MAIGINLGRDDYADESFVGNIRPRPLPNTLADYIEVSKRWGTADDRRSMAGVVKGIIEHGDGRRYVLPRFYDIHLRNAIVKGVIYEDETPTPRGRKWYDDRLHALSPLYAFYWDTEAVGYPDEA